VANASCESFRDASGSEQEDAVREMLSAHNDDTNVALTMLSVSAYCALHPGASISGVYGG